MFESLKQRWLDGRQILKVDEFEVGDGMHPHCGVHFADEKEPKIAVVHKDELEHLTFDNEKDSIEKRQTAFNTATTTLQQGMMDSLRFFNPKFKEIRKIVENISDSNGMFKDRFDRACFGGETGEYDKFTLKLSALLEILGKYGKEVDYTGITDKGKVLFKALLDIDASYEEGKMIFPSFAPFLNLLFSTAVELVVGMKANEIRLRDMIDFTEAYEAIHGAPKELGSEEVPKGDAPETEEKSEQSVSSAAPSSEGPVVTDSNVPVIAPSV